MGLLVAGKGNCLETMSEKTGCDATAQQSKPDHTNALGIHALTFVIVETDGIKVGVLHDETKADGFVGEAPEIGAALPFCRASNLKT